MINEMHSLLQDLAMPCRVRNKDKRLDDRFIPYLQWFASDVVVIVAVAAAVVVFYSLFYQNRSISVLIILKEDLAQKNNEKSVCM
jgi:hypothetical protein